MDYSFLSDVDPKVLSGRLGPADRFPSNFWPLFWASIMMMVCYSVVSLYFALLWWLQCCGVLCCLTRGKPVEGYLEYPKVDFRPQNEPDIGVGNEV